jgi:Immunity protein 42
MLSGNPDTFAIGCDAVDSWSTAGFKNGCFGYSIGGKLIWSSRSTLGVDLHRLSKLHCVNNAVEDMDLFNRLVNSAYHELCKRAFPPMDSDAQNNDFIHFVSVESLSDDEHNVFLVECAAQAKLIYGFNQDPSSIYEVD